MRQLIFLVSVTLAVMIFWSCAKNPAPPDRQRATVVMRDGTKVDGTVTASSATEVTIAGDDNITRTIPMKQVKSIEYGEAQTAPAEALAPQEPTTPARSGEPEPQAVARSSKPAGDRESRDRPSPLTPTPAPPPAPEVRTYDLRAGTQISVRSEETIDSAKAVEGQTYAAEVSNNVLDASGAVAIPKGSKAHLVIVSASRGGRFRGASDLALDLQSVSVHGQRYQLDTADIRQRGRSGVGANKRTAEFTGGGAVVGAIIGAIAGGGRGAAIGAGAGAGAGAVTQILTKGGSIRVPAESVLTFRLDKPLRVVGR